MILYQCVSLLEERKSSKRSSEVPSPVRNDDEVREIISKWNHPNSNSTTTIAKEKEEVI